MFDLFKRTTHAVKKSRQAWFGKIAGLFTKSTIDDQTWGQLEELLVSADVGVATTGKLLQTVKATARDKRLGDAGQVYQALKESMVAMLKAPGPAEPKAPPSLPDARRLIMVVGVNGSGKTTSIAKLARSFVSQGNHTVLVAADTFRAAAIDQLKHWGVQAGAEVVTGQPGSDPGAVVFDAIQAAEARHAGIVIVDTAGRLHTKYNLMEELKKIHRIASRWKGAVSQEVLLVVDATTGQNGVVQARSFSEAVGVTGIFLSKLDGTARGGIVLTIADQLKIPIRYIGTGEHMDDIAPFDAATFVEAIFAASDDKDQG